MTHNLKVHILKRSLMTLFGANKPNVTFLNHKDEYYKDYYFNQKLSSGIELVAKIERVSKKQAAELLMKAGLSSYMGGKLTEYIQEDRVAREQNQKNKNDSLCNDFETICQRTRYGYFKNYLMTLLPGGKSFSFSVFDNSPVMIVHKMAHCYHMCLCCCYEDYTGEGFYFPDELMTNSKKAPMFYCGKITFGGPQCTIHRTFELAFSLTI